MARSAEYISLDNKWAIVAKNTHWATDSVVKGIQAARSGAPVTDQTGMHGSCDIVPVTKMT